MNGLDFSVAAQITKNKDNPIVTFTIDSDDVTACSVVLKKIIDSFQEDSYIYSFERSKENSKTLHKYAKISSHTDLESIDYSKCFFGLVYYNRKIIEKFKNGSFGYINNVGEISISDSWFEPEKLYFSNAHSSHSQAQFSYSEKLKSKHFDNSSTFPINTFIQVAMNFNNDDQETKKYLRTLEQSDEQAFKKLQMIRDAHKEQVKEYLKEQEELDRSLVKQHYERAVKSKEEEAKKLAASELAEAKKMLEAERAAKQSKAQQDEMARNFLLQQASLAQQQAALFQQQQQQQYVQSPYMMQPGAPQIFASPPGAQGTQGVTSPSFPTTQGAQVPPK